MSDKVLSLFGNDDPRIESLLQEIKALIYERSVGIFQVATVIGILRIIEHEIIRDAA